MGARPAGHLQAGDRVAGAMVLEAPVVAVREEGVVPEEEAQATEAPVAGVVQVAAAEAVVDSIIRANTIDIGIAFRNKTLLRFFLLHP